MEDPLKKLLLALLLLAGVSTAMVLAQEQPQPPTGSARQATSRPPPKPGLKDRMFFGGGMGFGFGDVEWVELSPMVGIRILPRLSTGIGVTYRHTKDSRYDPDLTTSDFGGDVFAQVTVMKNIFAMVEYETLNYQYLATDLQKTGSSFNSVFAGGGVFQPLGGHASLVLSALYNLSYSADEPSPYGSPWVFNAGVSVGF